MNDAIYLDNNATSRVDPDVAAAMYECHLAGYGNPASQHRSGQQAHRVLEDARERIADLLDIDISSPSSDRLIFTSGGTEANNLALRGLLATDSNSDAFEEKSVFVSSIEHPSVLATASRMSADHRVKYIDCRDSGVVDVDHLQGLLTQPRTKTSVVSIMYGNNETGVMQPLADCVRVCRDIDPDIIFHTDAVQVAGKLPLSFQQLNVSAMTISAHKFHGPCGIGALAVRKGTKLSPLLFGGTQQLKLRPGTESVVAAVGMAKALEKWKSEAELRARKMGALRDRFEDRLTAELHNIVVNGRTESRLPHTSNVSFLGVDRQALLLALDFAGVYCSTGSACESGSSEPSHVLTAMGLSRELISSALRFSLSNRTTASEIDEAVRRISKSVKGLREGKSRRISHV